MFYAVFTKCERKPLNPMAYISFVHGNTIGYRWFTITNVNGKLVYKQYFDNGICKL